MAVLLLALSPPTPKGQHNQPTKLPEARESSDARRQSKHWRCPLGLHLPPRGGANDACEGHLADIGIDASLLFASWKPKKKFQC